MSSLGLKAMLMMAALFVLGEGSNCVYGGSKVPQ